MRHADYKIAMITPGFVAIIDLDIGGPSVTNDAEWVVKDLDNRLRRFPLIGHSPDEFLGGRRFFYRDTLGSWDEINLARHPNVSVLGFKPGGEIGAAIANWLNATDRPLEDV